jgi:hypothetical protein
MKKSAIRRLKDLVEEIDDLESEIDYQRTRVASSDNEIKEACELLNAVYQTRISRIYSQQFNDRVCGFLLRNKEGFLP